MFTVEGRTEDGRTVVSGVYNFVATYGVPLDAVLSHLSQNKMVLDIPAYCAEGFHHGVKKRSLVESLVFALKESYGAIYPREVETRLKELVPL